MRKILIVGMSNNIGGTETYFYNYYRHFDLTKYRFDFIAAWETVAFADEYKKNGSKIYSLPNFIKNPIGYYKKMRKIIRDEKYDVVHINMLSAANILPVKAAIAEKVSKVIVHSHNTAVPKGIFRSVLHNINKRFLVRSELIRLACSKKAGEWLFGKNMDFKILNNAIDLKKFRFDMNNRDEIRMKYNLRDNEILLGNVGRICEQKNQLFLIEIMKQLNDERIKLMIVGDGEQKDLLKDAAKRAGLIDRIILVPNTTDVERYYSAFDVFVLPSKFEGLPVSAVEAIANGLECILLDSISEYGIFKNQDFLEINNVSDWVKAILKKKNNKNNRRIDNTEHIQECGFDILTEYPKLLRIYDE